MSEQQSEQTSENENNSSFNDARFMSASSVQSTPPTRKQRPKQSLAKDKMKRLQRMLTNQDEQLYLRQALTISVKKKKSQHKTPLQKQKTGKTAKSQIKTAQVKNKKGCKLSSLCAICLCEFNIVRGSLDCLHQFCFQCIWKWCQSSTICPCCRKQIKSILKLARQTAQGAVKQTQRIPVQKKMLTFQSQYDHYICYQCGTGEDEHVLLICDQCDFYCCHIYCDQGLNSVMPQGDWFCIYCRNRRRPTRNADISEIIRTVLQSQAENQAQTQQSQFEDDSEDSKGVFMRTRSRNNMEITSAQRNNVNRLRDIRRRVR